MANKHWTIRSGLYEDAIQQCIRQLTVVKTHNYSIIPKTK